MLVDRNHDQVELLQHDAGDVGSRRWRRRQRVQAQLEQRRRKRSAQARGAGLNLDRAAVGLDHPQHGRRARSFAVGAGREQRAQTPLIERMDQVGDRQADHLVPPPTEVQQSQKGPIGIAHHAGRDHCRGSRHRLAQPGSRGGRVGHVRRPGPGPRPGLTEVRRLKDNGAEHQRSDTERGCRQAAGPRSDHRAIEQDQRPC